MLIMPATSVAVIHDRPRSWEPQPDGVECDFEPDDWDDTGLLSSYADWLASWSASLSPARRDARHASMHLRGFRCHEMATKYPSSGQQVSIKLLQVANQQAVTFIISCPEGAARFACFSSAPPPPPRR